MFHSATRASDSHPYRNISRENTFPEEESIADLVWKSADNNDEDYVVANTTIVVYKLKSNTSIDWERERIIKEFYATYDVMTGVRIAATLAGFFALMVMLVMYKSRTNTMRTLKDPDLAAAAVEMVLEEEERELQDVIDTLKASGLSLFSENEPLPYRQQRMFSLGNISAPSVLHSGTRHSSIVGYSSLLEPTKRSHNTTQASHRNAPLSNDFDRTLQRARHEKFRSSRNSSSDKSQCVSFDMEMPVSRPTRTDRYSSGGGGWSRSDSNAWLTRRSTFQRAQSDSIRNRNKIFLTNDNSNARERQQQHRDMQQQQQQHQQLDPSPIKLIRLQTNSNSRDDVDDDIVSETDNALILSDLHQQKNCVSTSSFIVASIDYQDADLKSINSESLFSESYVDTEDDDDEYDDVEYQLSSDDSDEKGQNHHHKAQRVYSGTAAYQKLKKHRPSVANQTETYSKSFPMRQYLKPAETRSLQQVIVQNKSDKTEYLYLPGTSTKWSKETLF